jgi:hypothetical protein
MKINFFHPLVLYVSIFFSCDMQNEIELTMPVHIGKPVVECYLQPGETFKLVLSKTVNYMDDPGTPYLNDAEVKIRFLDKEIILEPNHLWNPVSRKFYNYISLDTVPELYDVDFHLEIKLEDGRKISSSAKMLKPKKILKTEWKLLNDKGLINIVFEKDTHQNNYFRLLVNNDSPTGSTYLNSYIEGSVVPGDRIFLSTGYDFELGQEIYITLNHISFEYYQFLESVQSAIVANITPFTQPNRIISNINGGFGIFAGLPFDKKKVVIGKIEGESIIED